GVGDVEFVAGEAEAAWFVEGARCLTQECPADAPGRVDPFDLAVVGVGDIELALETLDIQGVLQTDLWSRAGLVAENVQPASADRLDKAGAAKRQGTNGAGLAIGDIEQFAISPQTARLSEAGERQRAVLDAFHIVPGVRADYLALDIHNPDLMVP